MQGLQVPDAAWRDACAWQAARRSVAGAAGCAAAQALQEAAQGLCTRTGERRARICVHVCVCKRARVGGSVSERACLACALGICVALHVMLLGAPLAVCLPRAPSTSQHVPGMLLSTHAPQSSPATW